MLIPEASLGGSMYMKCTKCAPTRRPAEPFRFPISVDPPAVESILEPIRSPGNGIRVSRHTHSGGHDRVGHAGQAPSLHIVDYDTHSFWPFITQFYEKENLSQMDNRRTLNAKRTLVKAGLINRSFFQDLKRKDCYGSSGMRVPISSP